MMQLTKCEGTSLVQFSGEKPLAPKVCKTGQVFEINFADGAKQDKLERMMTPGARKAINEILGRVQATQAKDAAKLLQQSAKVEARCERKVPDVGDNDDGDDVATKGHSQDGQQV